MMLSAQDLAKAYAAGVTILSDPEVRIPIVISEQVSPLRQVLKMLLANELVLAQAQQPVVETVESDEETSEEPTDQAAPE